MSDSLRSNIKGLTLLSNSERGSGEENDKLQVIACWSHFFNNAGKLFSQMKELSQFMSCLNTMLSQSKMARKVWKDLAKRGYISVEKENDKMFLKTLPTYSTTRWFGMLDAARLVQVNMNGRKDFPLMVCKNKQWIQSTRMEDVRDEDGNVQVDGFDDPVRERVYVVERKFPMQFYLEELRRKKLCPAHVKKLLSYFFYSSFDSLSILLTQLDVLLVLGKKFAQSCYALEVRSFISPFIYDLLLEWKDLTVCNNDQYDLLVASARRRQDLFENELLKEGKQFIKDCRDIYSLTSTPSRQVKEKINNQEALVGRLESLGSTRNSEWLREQKKLDQMIRGIAFEQFTKRADAWNRIVPLQKLKTQIQFAKQAVAYVKGYMFVEGYASNVVEDPEYGNRYRRLLPILKNIRIFDPEHVVKEVNKEYEMRKPNLVRINGGLPLEPLQEANARIEVVKYIVVGSLKQLTSVCTRSFPVPDWKKMEERGVLGELWDEMKKFKPSAVDSSVRKRANTLHAWWIKARKNERIALFWFYARRAMLILGSQTDAERMISILSSSRNKLQTRASNDTVEVAAMVRYNRGTEKNRNQRNKERLSK